MILVRTFVAACIGTGILAATFLPNALARQERPRPADGPTIKMPGAIAGKVIHVDDGDTLIVLDTEGFKRTIRLSDIDAPEASHGASRPGQPFSAKATQHLKSIALGQQAQASCFDIDARPRPDGALRERYICRLTVDGRDINRAMIEAGLAMAYRRYVRDQSSILHEDRARKAHLGLWQQSQPIAPWEWRKACWEQRHCDQAGE